MTSNTPDTPPENFQELSTEMQALFREVLQRNGYDVDVLLAEQTGTGDERQTQNK